MPRTSWKATVSLVAAVALWGCGDGSSGSSATGPTSPGAGGPAITILGERGAQSFQPNPSPTGGQTVVFRNTDNVIHRVRLNDGTLDSGDIAPGATSRAMAMPAAGTNYHCSLHPGMIGSIGPAAGGSPPPCEGIYC